MNANIFTMNNDSNNNNNWTIKEQKQLINIVNGTKQVGCQISWSDIVSLWHQQYPNDIELVNQTKLKSCYQQAINKSNPSHVTNNYQSDELLPTNHNSQSYADIDDEYDDINTNDYATSNMNANIFTMNNDSNNNNNEHLITINNHTTITSDNCIKNATTTTNNNNNNNNINNNDELRNINTHTSLRCPKHKQPFSLEELQILTNALKSYHESYINNKTIRWDKIHYLYNTEATKQYAQDNTKPIFARTNKQLEEKYKSSKLRINKI